MRILFLRSLVRGVWRNLILMGKTSLTLSLYINLIAELETYRLIRNIGMVREDYMAPVVDVIEVEVEHGFAATGTDGTGNDMPWG